MPGKTDAYYEAMGRLVIAREFATQRIHGIGVSGHEISLYGMVAEIVDWWLYAPMSDDAMQDVVAYVQALLQCASKAADLIREAPGNE